MKKILIIDDEPDSIAVFELLLSGLNYTISGVTNPLNAVQSIRDILPDLIIMDWLMPQKEGIEVLKEIKSHPDLQEIPVIISTGLRTHSSDLKMALEAGATDFIRKPVDEIELEARVTSAIRLYDYMVESRKKQNELHTNELELAEIRSRLLQNELNKKEREMVVAAVSTFQNRKLLSVVRSEIFTDNMVFPDHIKTHLNYVLDKYDNIANTFNWQLFEKRVLELNKDFYNNLQSEFSGLTSGELRLCAYFRIGLSIKEVATLNYSNYEAVRKAVYRIRKKLNLNEKTDLSIFLQGY